MIQRGFRIYVGRIWAQRETMLHVGRTGDESSPHASATYDRFGQNLGRNDRQNALRRNLETRGITLPQVDYYDFLFYGPVHPEATDMAAHIPLRDAVAAAEKKLADSLGAAGYTVLNRVNCRRPLDPALWDQVRAGFIGAFPELADH